MITLNIKVAFMNDDFYGIDALTMPEEEDIPVEAYADEARSEERAPEKKSLRDEELVPGITVGMVEDAVYDNERGAARLFTIMFRPKYLFDSECGDWNIFSEDTGHVLDVGKQRIADLYQVAGLYNLAAAKIDSKDFYKLVKTQCDKINSSKGAEAILKMATAGEGSLSSNGLQWDTVPYLFPFKNGILDVRSGEFRKYRRTDYFKFKADVDYDPEAKCPRFEAALLDAMNGDERMANFVQSAFGYMATRIGSDDKIFLLWGRGGNFKGVLLETIQAATGMLSTSMPIEMLLKQLHPANPDSPSPSTLNLRGKMAAIFSEPDEGKVFGSGKLKELSGGNYLTARAPYDKSLVRFRPTHTIVIEANYKPHISADDDGSWRRLLLIEFPVSYVDNPDPANPLEHKRDNTLKEYLRLHELPGVANWLIKGAQMWLAGKDGTGKAPGFNYPEKVLQATAEYRRSEDSLQDFIDECLEINVGPERQIKGTGDNYHSSVVYKHYQEWARSQGYTASSMLKQTSFSTKIRAKLNLKAAHDTPGAYFPGVIIRNPDKFVMESM